MQCFMCGWIGHPDDLVAITDEPESINDFVHCPICKCNVWEDEEALAKIETTPETLLARFIVINYNKKSEGPIYSRDIYSQDDYTFYMEFLLGADGSGGYQLIIEDAGGNRIKARFAAKRYALGIA